MQELSQFATWLAAGLTWSLLVTSAREVNHGYFRGSCLVVLGLIVVATLARFEAGRSGGTALLIAAGMLAYLAFMAWHLNWQRSGKALVAGLAAALLVGSLPAADALFSAGAWNAISGAALLGLSLSTMLLGHYYLTAPWMSLGPLYRLIALLLAACALRLATSICLALNAEGLGTLLAENVEMVVFLGLRWLIGIAAPLLLCLLVWRTLHYKNTQAATGILYVIVIFAMLGEATAIALSRVTGVSL